MIVRPKRNLLQRILNRSLHRFGFKPFPVRFESSLPEAGSDPATVFNAIYATNYWESDESKSGPGSERDATARYVPQLISMIRDFGIRSIFDAPCGDLNWMPEVIAATSVSYVGGDIAEEAVAHARLRHPDLDIREFDICEDEFPTADLWHCRDTLFHLSFKDIERAFVNAVNAQIEFAAITTHRARYLKNLDIRTGGFRLLDLERPPFNFPKPICYLRDYPPGHFPRYVAIWRIADLQSNIGSNQVPTPSNCESNL